MDTAVAPTATVLPAPAAPVSQLAGLLLAAGHIDRTALDRALRLQPKLETPQPLVKTLQDLGLVDTVTVRANRTAMRLGDLPSRPPRIRWST